MIDKSEIAKLVEAFDVAAQKLGGCVPVTSPYDQQILGEYVVVKTALLAEIRDTQEFWGSPGHERNRLLDELASLRAAVEGLAAALKTSADAAKSARYELAALLPDPKNYSTDEWPINNRADALCLEAAYGVLLEAEEDARAALSQRQEGTI